MRSVGFAAQHNYTLLAVTGGLDGRRAAGHRRRRVCHRVPARRPPAVRRVHVLRSGGHPTAALGEVFQVYANMLYFLIIKT